MKIRETYRRIQWSANALFIDVALFLGMLFLGRSLCSGSSSSCYRLAPSDRFADYLALVVAVMAILIPVSIELWKRQFVELNLSQKSPLDSAWFEEDRIRYLCEPIASMAIFVLITTLLPLFISSSALFYADVFYGLFLLTYVFFVSFFKKPLDIYDLPVLNPQGHNLPPREIISELSTITLEKSIDQTAPTSVNIDPLTWTVQLSQSKTLERLTLWARSTLTGHPNGDVNKMLLWSTFINYITNCELDILWLPAYEKQGSLHTFFADKKSYTPNNLPHIAQMLEIITSRFASIDNYYETVGTLLSTIPVSGIPEKDLIRLFGSTFRMLFSKSDKNDLIISSNIPNEWVITLNDADDKLPRVTLSIYLQWLWSLQMQSGEIPETAVHETTIVLFPEVEPILFAKFLLLYINMARLQLVSNDEAAEIFSEAIGKWNIFGNIGRVNVDWAPSKTEESLDERFRQDFLTSETVTIKLAEKLGWFPWNRQQVNTNTQLLRSIIHATDLPDYTKKSWLVFVDKLETMFKDENADNDNT